MTMTECNGLPLTFSSLGRKEICADFTGRHLTSDAGALLLCQIDEQIGLIDALAACLSDPRDPAKTRHDVWTLLAQRILKLLVQRLRQAWPKVRILVRADSGFCRWKLPRWCGRHQVDYLIGPARNRVLQDRLEPWMQRARHQQAAYSCKLLKIGARISCIVVHLAAGYPLKDLLCRLVQRLREPHYRPT